MNPKVTYEIKKQIKKIERHNESVQLNLMSWGKGEVKYDLRRWSDDETPLKGLSLTENELKLIYESLNDIFNPKEIKNEGVTPHIIDFRKFLVRSSDICITQGHDTEPVKAVVYVLTKFNKIKELMINATHCRECKCYYISKYEYNSLKAQGRIMCQVVTKQQYDDYLVGVEWGTLQPESKLHIAGYNLSDGLSQAQRQTILTYVIESGLMTKKEVINHLSFLIHLNENKKMAALDEWRADREFLTGYKEGAKKLVGIKYILV